MAVYRNYNPTETGFVFGKNLFSDHRTVRLIKLMRATRLSAAILRSERSLSINHGFITAQCTLVQSAVLRSHVVRLSVCLSVRL